jgi:hypothetical protein
MISHDEFAESQIHSRLAGFGVLGLDSAYPMLCLNCNTNLTVWEISKLKTFLAFFAVSASLFGGHILIYAMRCRNLEFNRDQWGISRIF